MNNYKGSIELISGITPKNGGKFPLVNAKDVLMPDGSRLSDLQGIEQTYNSLQDAINRVNPTDYGSVGARYENGQLYVTLLWNITLDESAWINETVLLNLNGHTINITNIDACIEVVDGSLTIDGSTPGSKIKKCNLSSDIPNQEFRMINTADSNLTLIGGKYIFSDIVLTGTNSQLRVIRHNGSPCYISDVEIEMYNPDPYSIGYAIHSSDPVHIKDSKIRVTSGRIAVGIAGTSDLYVDNLDMNCQLIEGYPNKDSWALGIYHINIIDDINYHTLQLTVNNSKIITESPLIGTLVYSVISQASNPNKVKLSYDKPVSLINVTNCHLEADGYSDYKVDGGSAKVVGVYSLSAGSYTKAHLNGGYYWGGRDAISTHGKVRIDGGIFGGPQHGGAYISGDACYARNAIFCSTNAKKYWNDVDNWHGGCIYIGGSSGETKAYFDNCKFVGAAKSTSNGVCVKYGPTYAYLSNCEVVETLGTMGGHLRVTNVSNFIYLGKNVITDGTVSKPNGVIDWVTYKDKVFDFTTPEYLADFGDYKDVEYDTVANDWDTIAKYGINVSALHKLVNANSSQITNIKNDIANLSAIISDTPAFNPEMFGAVGDGVTDDTAAIIATVNRCKADNKKYKFAALDPNKKYLISSTIDMRGIDVDIQGTINVSHHGIGLIVGGSSEDAEPCIININSIYHKQANTDDISIRIVGLMNGDVTIRRAYFVQLYADANDKTIDSIAYSKFNIGTCEYLYIQDKAHDTDNTKKAWINENVFFNCRVLRGFLLEGTSYCHDSNVFYKPCFEGASVELKNCALNKFYDVRNESAPGLQFSLEMDNRTKQNHIQLGYSVNHFFLTDQQLHITDNGVNNTITYAGLDSLESVLFYNINSKTVAENMYKVDANNIVPQEDVVTIQQNEYLLDDVIIPVDGIKYLVGKCDSGNKFRWYVTPLDDNKNEIYDIEISEGVRKFPLCLQGLGNEPKFDRTYTTGWSEDSLILSIEHSSVKYLRLKIGVETYTSASFHNLSLVAYYDPRNELGASQLLDALKRSGRDYVTPQDFGAKADGVHDDTAALQAAFNTGAAVRIPTGRYLVTERLFTKQGTKISGEGNSSVILCESNQDLIMVAYATTITNLKIELVNVKNALTGSIFKMNEESLIGCWPFATGDVRTYISNILIEGNAAVRTDGHVSCFETSLMGPWGDAEHAKKGEYRYGIYGLNVSNVNAMIGTGAKIGYFYRSYVGKETYSGNTDSVKTCWVTSISFSNCGIIGPRWGFFMGYQDDNMFDEEHIGMCQLTAYNVYHQKTDDNCIGFLFQRANTRVSLFGCEPWDWNQHGDISTHCPYVIDKELCGDAGTYWLDNNRGNIQNYRLIGPTDSRTGGTRLTHSDYGIYYSFLKTPFRQDFFKRAQALRLPAMDGVASKPITLLASLDMSASLSQKIITFEYQYLTVIAKCAITLQPTLKAAGMFKGFETDLPLPSDAAFFYLAEDYKDANGNDRVSFKLYHWAGSGTWSYAAVVKEDCFTNSIAHFSGHGCQFADQLATVNGLKYNKYMLSSEFDLEASPSKRVRIYPSRSAMIVPVPTEADNGKVLTVRNGEPVWAEIVDTTLAVSAEEVLL